MSRAHGRTGGADGREYERRGPRDRDALRYYGRAVCIAILEERPSSVDRVFVRAVRSRDPRETKLVRSLIRGRIAHREVEDDELERLAESRHHEGVVLFARPPAWPSWRDLLAPDGPAQVALLEAALNPHNLGAIVRSAAHFGVRAVASEGGTPNLSGASARIAEGASERVAYASVESMEGALASAREHGYFVAAGTASGDLELFDWDPPGRRVVWLLGREGTGLSREWLDAADGHVRVPGTGRVESLNVSVAAGLLFAEGWRMARRSVSSSAP